jgi:hypothetical protein
VKETLDKLRDIVENLPANFYGSVEVGFQNSKAGTVKITRSYRLDAPVPNQPNRPLSRGAFDDKRK